ncbi:MAG: hypothetical protein QFB86_02980 [Patescibacteria group bacterium]|nr:hypothetical protein [Patescibacteria group bacterium]
MANRRVGVYAGTFNPVHAGHIAFALQALATAKLDGIYFLPERQPRYKKGVEHFAHRLAMLDRALEPHPKLRALDLPDINFTVQRTLPRLQKIHPDDQLVFLVGSELLATLPGWPYSDQLLKQAELVIGLRGFDTAEDVDKELSVWKIQPKFTHIVQSYAPRISSTVIRDALRRKQRVQGLLHSVERYSDRHWLYVSLA